jgi:hypothetical protein
MVSFDGFACAMIFLLWFFLCYGFFGFFWLLCTVFLFLYLRRSPLRRIESWLSGCM